MAEAQNKTELIRLIGVSRQTFYTYVRRPDAPKGLDIDEWKAFVQNTQTNIRIPRANRATPTNGDERYDYGYERARKTHMGAELDLIKLEATRRNIFPKAEVIETFTGIVTVFKARLLKLEGELPCALEGRPAVEIQKIVREKITDALNALSIPEAFFLPVSEV
jgi:hypothetical protein